MTTKNLQTVDGLAPLKEFAEDQAMIVNGSGDRRSPALAGDMIPSLDPSLLSPAESAALAALPSVQTFWYVSGALQAWYLRGAELRVRRVAKDGTRLSDRRSRI